LKKSCVLLTRNTDGPLYSSWKNNLSFPIIEARSFDSDFIFSKYTSIVVTHDIYRDISEIVLKRIIKNQVPVLVLADGIIEFRNSWTQNHKNSTGVYSPILGHKLACIGPSQCRFVESWGNLGKCENVGFPRFDNLEFNFPTNPKPPKILICTAKTPWFTSAEKEKIVHSLSDLKDKSKFYEKIGLCNFVWRLTGELPKIFNINSRDHISIYDDINQSTAVITTPSTVILEAMLAKRPVALLDYTNSPTYVQVAWTINQSEQIESTVTELLEIRKEKMNFQNVSLNDSLQLKQSANERMVELIEKMVFYSENCKVNGRDLKLPHKILDD